MPVPTPKASAPSAFHWTFQMCLLLIYFVSMNTEDAVPFYQYFWVHCLYPLLRYHHPSVMPLSVLTIKNPLSSQSTYLLLCFSLALSLPDKGCLWLIEWWIIFGSEWQWYTWQPCLQTSLGWKSVAQGLFFSFGIDQWPKNLGRRSWSTSSVNSSSGERYPMWMMIGFLIEAAFEMASV